jgi:hypothetical protein
MVAQNAFKSNPNDLLEQFKPTANPKSTSLTEEISK